MEPDLLLVPFLKSSKAFFIFSAPSVIKISPSLKSFCMCEVEARPPETG
jgi:hypothetical protein